jgi:ssDNA-binding Zn-finger/Zn-ribbon topoisomerase 1
MAISENPIDIKRNEKCPKCGKRMMVYDVRSGSLHCLNCHCGGRLGRLYRGKSR